MRKNKIIFSTVAIIFCIVIASVAYGINNSRKIPRLSIPKGEQGSPKVVYEFSLDTSSFPKEAIVYKFTTPKVDNDLMNILKVFKLGGVTDRNEDNQRLLFKNGSQYLEYEKSTGYWSFTDNYRLSDISIKSNLPDDDEAVNIAKEFLLENKFLSDRFQEPTVVSQSSGDKTTNDYHIIYKDVYFYPAVNNSPILGVSRIIITIGNNSEIIAVKKYSKDYEIFEPRRLISVNNAFKSVKSNKASSNIDPKAIKAKITKVSLGYWEDAGSLEEQPYLQPIWIFAGEATLSDGTTKKFDAVVPALEDN